MISLKCMLRKRNQVQFHWNTCYDNATEASDNEFDSFVLAQIFNIVLTILRALERNVRSGIVNFYIFSGTEVRTWNTNSNNLSSIRLFSSSFLGDLFELGLASSNYFLGTVIFYQLKHCYMKHIVVPSFDQQQWSKDSSAWYSGYVWRLVVVVFSLSLSLCCLFAGVSITFLVGLS